MKTRFAIARLSRDSTLMILVTSTHNERRWDYADGLQGLPAIASGIAAVRQMLPSSMTPSGSNPSRRHSLA
jgi:hypothetical protein